MRGQTIAVTSWPGTPGRSEIQNRYFIAYIWKSSVAFVLSRRAGWNRLPAAALNLGIDVEAFRHYVARVADDQIAFAKAAGHVQAIAVIALDLDFLEVERVVRTDQRHL
jgi:hypothetical protein